MHINKLKPLSANKDIINSASDKPGNEIKLKRVLGLTTAILLVAGNVIGTGVFKKIVPMAATGLSENYILGAWILAGIVTMLGALSVAGLRFWKFCFLCFAGNWIN